MQDALAQQMAQEEAARAAAARGAAQMPWLSAIVAKIQRNWQRPPGSADRFNCVVRLEQLPGGEVVRATVIRSCGTPVLDRSVENAVLKSSPLPTPPDPALFERVIDVRFCPTPDAC
jgi:colicin import membrane protein